MASRRTAGDGVRAKRRAREARRRSPRGRRALSNVASCRTRVALGASPPSPSGIPNAPVSFYGFVRTEESAVTFLTFSVLLIIKTRSFCEI